MLRRLWIYQRERFPLAAMAALALLLAAAAMLFSARLRGAPLPAAGALCAAAASVFLVFIQMRVFDEFKDREDDARYRPYRPVPRGLVSLAELRGVQIAASAGMIVIALALDARLLWLLAALWGYLLLMAVEFFAPVWLRARHFAYLVSHIPFGGLIALYASAFEWLPRGAHPHPALLLLAAAVLFDSTLLEIGRKIRAPRDEETGVATYSHVWGPTRATLAWLAAFALLLVFGLLAAHATGDGATFTLLMAPLALVAALCALRYLRRPENAKAFEPVSGVVSLALFTALGPLPVLLSV
jgi:4-hydroxybenzoate polyprenyltransferase